MKFISSKFEPLALRIVPITKANELIDIALAKYE